MSRLLSVHVSNDMLRVDFLVESKFCYLIELVIGFPGIVFLPRFVMRLIGHLVSVLVRWRA